MPKIEYQEQRFNTKSRKLIGVCNEIIELYMRQGYQLTLRQLYYRLVTKNVIVNHFREYKKLVALVNNARLAGLIDWEAIIDRTRYLATIPNWNTPKDMLDQCARQFTVDMWAKQEFRPEIWIEKDALVGVIERISNQLHVPYFSCRGYTSQSEMWGAANRLIEYQAQGKEPFIIHLGDHDPSGKDMTRDIQYRMELFGAFPQFKRIALNMDQIKKYKPEPNPVKIRDSRYHGYVKEFGRTCWELDALEPKVINSILEKQVKELITDVPQWNKDTKLAKRGRGQLKKIATKFQQALKAAGKKK